MAGNLGGCQGEWGLERVEGRSQWARLPVFPLEASLLPVGVLTSAIRGRGGGLG